MNDRFIFLQGPPQTKAVKWRGYGALLSTMALASTGFWAQDGCYVTTQVSRLPLALIGALVVGAVVSVLTKDLRQKGDPMGVPMPLTFLVTGAIGFALTWSWLTALPRFTSTGVRTYETAYVLTQGGSRCPYGAQFSAGPEIAADITGCGHAWGIPAQAGRGRVRVTEKLSPYSIQILNVEYVPDTP